MPEFSEVWAETIRHVHAILAETETVRYARADGTTMRVKSLSIGLIARADDVHHVEVYGTTEDGHHAEDRFLQASTTCPARSPGSSTRPNSPSP